MLALPNAIRVVRVRRAHTAAKPPMPAGTGPDGPLVTGDTMRAWLARIAAWPSGAAATHRPGSLRLPSVHSPAPGCDVTERP